MLPFHITFSLDLSPFRAAPYFSARPQLADNTVTDPKLIDDYRAATFGHNPEWDQFVMAFSNLIVLHTKNEFEQHTVAAGLTEDERKTAWHSLCRSSAFFGVTSLFSLHEFLKNSLEADAETVRFHICRNENEITCIVTDNGTGFVHKKFRTLFAEKDASLTEPLINYSAEIMTSGRGITSPKKRFLVKKKIPRTPAYSCQHNSARQRPIQLLKSIDEELPAWGLTVGGAGRGLAMTLQAMELGGGAVNLTNVDRLADICVLADIRQNMDESGRGSVILLSSPPMNADTFETLMDNREKFMDQPQMLYFHNLDWNKMEKPGITAVEIPDLSNLDNIISLRTNDGSVHSLSLADLPVHAEKQHSPCRKLREHANQKMHRQRKTPRFFNTVELKEETKTTGPSISPLMIFEPDSENLDEIVVLSPQSRLGSTI